MKLVRQRMIKPFTFLVTLSLLGILGSCNPTEITGGTVSGNSFTNDGSFDGKAYVYSDSPYYLSGPNSSPYNVNMGKLARDVQLITPNTQLTGNCTIRLFFETQVDTLSDCVRVLRDSSTDQIVPRLSNRTYIFASNSTEFYQANTLYHVMKGTDKFFQKLAFAYDQVRFATGSVPKSIPSYMFNSRTFWFKAMSDVDARLFQNDFLTTYAQCELDSNASFSPAGPSLCFGGISAIPGFWFVQDPSIIYHELGHALVSVMMNLRNGTSAIDYHPLRSNLGSYGYDEAGSVNEGIADYYSYIINGRESVGEYALGKTFAQARPLSESHSMHIPGVEETSEGRLSYPQYLHYDPNNPDDPMEDVHYAGQITTHYLVALTKALKNSCGLTSESDGGHSTATSFVMLLLAETLSELGDLNARGADRVNGALYTSAENLFFNNMDKTNSYLWTQVLNQVTYRRFYQVFGKNINKYISGNLCPSFTVNISEKLLDDYGLLLFKTYNNNMNATTRRDRTIASVVSGLTPSSYALTSVSEDNRRKSVLISKELIELAARTDANPNRVGFYIIDNTTDIQALLQELLFKGYTVPVSSNVAGTVYNNNNVRVSPGEVVAIIPNLLNKSNSTMAGIQLLATDWDHVHITDQSTGYFRPCVYDVTTTVDQGGEAGNTCTTPTSPYKRLVKDTNTNLFPAEASAPICLVQLEENDSTRWVSQSEYRRKQGLALQDKDCLGYTTSPTSITDFSFTPHECLVRFLPGANDAFFSKIDSQKTYYETMSQAGKEFSFNVGNVLMMEVNKWIPPGTKFRCRMRARFSNCTDCYTDGTNGNDDYLDLDLNGKQPYKIINFEFDVND